MVKKYEKYENPMNKSVRSEVAIFAAFEKLVQSGRTTAQTVNTAINQAMLAHLKRNKQEIPTIEEARRIMEGGKR